MTSVFKGDSVQAAMHSWVATTENTLVIELINEGASFVSVALELWVQTGGESQVGLLQEDNVSIATRNFNGPDLDWPTEVIIAMDTLDHNGQQFELEDDEYYVEKAVTAVESLDRHGLSNLL